VFALSPSKVKQIGFSSLAEPAKLLAERANLLWKPFALSLAPGRSPDRDI
jgi:hypothetical protein